MALTLTAAQETDLQKFRRLTGHETAPYTVREWLDAKVQCAWSAWQSGRGTKGYAAYAALVALREGYEPSDENYQTADERAGFEAFPAGRWMDASRGGKSYPEHARCPFRDTFRVRAWERGYDEALHACAKQP